jgi:adenine deaminase
MNVLRACTLNPARHYNIPGGLMQAGDPANYIIVKNLETMDVAEVRIDGKRVAGNGISDIQRIPTSCPNLFYENPVSIGNIQIRATGSKANVIQVHDGQIVTSALVVHPKIVNEFVVEDLENDILKIILLNRYQKSRPAMGLVKGFGLKRGAFASSVAHDSHNIVAVGSNDEDICLAIELINRNKGGICFVDGSNKYILPLAVGGILSNDSAENVASAYERLDTLVKAAGSALQAPYMSLSFMALLVIPSLKMSDKGLFDSENFSFKNLIF